MDEVIVNIDRIETIRKEHTVKIALLIVGLMSIGIVIMHLSKGETMFDSIFDYIGFVIFISGLSFLGICATKPSLLKIADFDYHKTILTNKWEYDDFKKSNSEKEDWKR